MNVAPQLKKITFAKFPPALPINVDHSFRHYGHFVSGQHCAGGRGEVLPRFGMLENSPKTVKCVITFETDCSCNLATPMDILVTRAAMLFAFATVLAVQSSPAKLVTSASCQLFTLSLPKLKMFLFPTFYRENV